MTLRRWLLCAALLYPGLATAETPLRERVQSRLSFIDSGVPTQAELRAYGPGLDVALQSIAQDKSLIFGIRQRALSALAVTGGPVAQKTLEDFLDDPATPADLLTYAGPAYVRGFRATQPAAVLKRAAVLLRHQDWLVRKSVVVALSDWDNLAAVDLLSKQAASEQHPTVQKSLEKAAVRATRK